MSLPIEEVNYQFQQSLLPDDSRETSQPRWSSSAQTVEYQQITGRDVSDLINVMGTPNATSFKGCDKNCLAQKINNFFFHGTNSAILPGIEGTNFELHATGDLLNQGIAPMGGEIRLGGMLTNGINQTSISGDNFQGISRCWDTYAKTQSNSFNENKFNSENMQKLFLKTLNKLEKSSPNSDDWDPLIIKLLRMKQWNYAEFKKLITENQERIADIISTSQNTLSPVQKIIKIMNYDINELKLAIADKSIRDHILKDIGYSHQLDAYLDRYWNDKLHFLNETHSSICPIANRGILWKDVLKPGDVDGIILDVINFRLSGQFDKLQKVPFLKEGEWTPIKVLQKDMERRQNDGTEASNTGLKKRIKRLELLFNLNHRPVKFTTESARECIRNPFPILLGSTTLGIKQNDRHSECIIPSGAMLGSDFDMMFVRKQDYTFTKAWLQQHNLSNRVSLYNDDVLEKAKSLVDLTLQNFAYPSTVPVSQK